MPKAILFDVDGTLVDSNEYHVTVWQRVFADVGARLDRSIIHAQVGKGGDNLIPALLPGASKLTREQLDEAHGRIFREEFINRVKPFPHARELLARCKEAGLVTVLASSSGRSDLYHYIDLLDARDLLDATTSSDDVAHTKPCPDIFQAASRKVGVDPADALAIGDTPYDIEAAKRSGMGMIAVRSGQFTDPDLAGAVAVYDDVAEILTHFERAILGKVPA